MKKSLLLVCLLANMICFSQASDSITLEPLAGTSSYEDSAGWSDDFDNDGWDDDYGNDWDDDYGYGDYRPRYPRQMARCAADLVMGRKVVASFRAKARGQNFRHARRKACRKAMRKCKQGFRGRNVMPSFGMVRCQIHVPGRTFGPY
jgi:hypothetical protein